LALDDDGDPREQARVVAEIEKKRDSERKRAGGRKKVEV